MAGGYKRSYKLKQTCIKGLNESGRRIISKFVVCMDSLLLFAYYQMKKISHTTMLFSIFQNTLRCENFIINTFQRVQDL